MFSVWGRMPSCGGLLTRPVWVEKRRRLPYGRASEWALPSRDRKGVGALNKRSWLCTP
jgi:hypothetical protein